MFQFLQILLPALAVNGFNVKWLWRSVCFNLMESELIFRNKRLGFKFVVFFQYLGKEFFVSPECPACFTARNLETKEASILMNPLQTKLTALVLGSW